MSEMSTEVRREPTLAAVAAGAGVSIATASKVLNGRSDVAPATRERVEGALKDSGYVARRTRRESSPSQLGGVELMFQGTINAYGIEVLQGVLTAAAASGVAVVVSRHDRGAPRHTGQWARELATSGRRAVIAVVDDLTAGAVAALGRAHIPLVVIDPLNLPDDRVPSVGSTNFAGGLAATRHLLGLGHRRIAYVGGPATAECNQARMQGYRAAMEAAGVPVPDHYVRTGTFCYDDGVREGAVLLDLPEPPTAVFSASDETAAGVIEAARARGLRIPDDLSVVGFDDTQVAQLSAPRLTTVRQPLREMGAVAIRTALQLAAGEQLDSSHVELATSLVIRESTAPAPSQSA